MPPELWSNQRARAKFRAGMVHRIAEGYLCGLCVYFSRNSDSWGWCRNFLCEWKDSFLHEEFSCAGFELSPKFVTYAKEHPGECGKACKLT